MSAPKRPLYAPNPIQPPDFDSLELACALAGPGCDALEAIERNTVQCALYRARGDQGLAAKILGITPAVMHHKCRVYKLRHVDRERRENEPAA